MSKLEELSKIQELDAEKRLQIIVKTINSNFKYRSLYIHGSRATGSFREHSDYDMLLIMDLPIILGSWRKFGLVYQWRKKHQIDLEIISRAALERSAQGIELMNWQREIRLISGERTLPIPVTLTNRSVAINTCNMALRLLRSIEVSPEGAKVNPYRLRSIVSYMSKDAKINAIPEKWKEISLLVRKEYESGDANAQLLCKAFDDYLSEVKTDIRFSFFDQMLFVLMNLLERREFFFSTLFRKRPIQLRYVDAIIALLRSVSESHFNDLISKSFDSLTDRLGKGAPADHRQTWRIVRDEVARYWDSAVRLPFGLIIYKRRIILL